MKAYRDEMGSEPPGLSLTDRNTTEEAATSRPYSPLDKFDNLKFIAAVSYAYIIPKFLMKLRCRDVEVYNLGKDACKPPESRWSPPPTDTRNPRFNLYKAGENPHMKRKIAFY
ncbi:hypothetical protein EVAR_22366_1 [Eumeta japonica]|uniref:Uncharacterized protein n=1 Tax=Eumeta variegata TaxID=151549 RepID=A0A4C1VK95_EUMVA|nr:hypothetical protein EVAR_22366_1 [Eumeta japonica]